MVFDGTSVRDAIQQLMERQTVKRWTMDACDFEQTVALSMSNISILEGIRKLCEELDAYTWECDTSALPFRLSIRKADAESKCGIHYGRNLTGIQMQMDTTELVTRLYLIGGTGKDGKTVTVESLTADAVPYIDADTIHSTASVPPSIKTTHSPRRRNCWRAVSKCWRKEISRKSA